MLILSSNVIVMDGKHFVAHKICIGLDSEIID